MQDGRPSLTRPSILFFCSWFSHRFVHGSGGIVSVVPCFVGFPHLSLSRSLALCHPLLFFLKKKKNKNN